MVNAFEFATAGRIVFGEGKLREIGSAAKAFGDKALLVTGGNSARASKAAGLLNQAGVHVEMFSFSGEPDVALVQRGSEVARVARCDAVIGFGGGSALDAAKAIAALTTNTADIFDYLEVIGKAQPLTASPLPVIAVPTTAGTGSEVTRNAVLTSKDHRVKVSLRSPGMLPRVAIVDPELTRELPPALTASTGMDALTQVIEPFVCARANPMTDGLCREAIARAATALARAFKNGADAEARRDMALVSVFGGLALANAGLGAVHGFAAPIGGMFDAPHGAVCAALLPGVMEANIEVASVTGASQTSARYDEVAQLLTRNPRARADDGVRWVRDLRAELRIVPLREWGIRREEFGAIADKAAQSSSMKANAVPLERARLMEILDQAW